MNYFYQIFAGAGDYFTSGVMVIIQSHLKQNRRSFLTKVYVKHYAFYTMTQILSNDIHKIIKHENKIT